MSEPASKYSLAISRTVSGWLALSSSGQPPGSSPWRCRYVPVAPSDHQDVAAGKPVENRDIVRAVLRHRLLCPVVYGAGGRGRARPTGAAHGPYPRSLWGSDRSDDWPRAPPPVRRRPAPPGTVPTPSPSGTRRCRCCRRRWLWRLRPPGIGGPAASTPGPRRPPACTCTGTSFQYIVRTLANGSPLVARSSCRRMLRESYGGDRWLSPAFRYSDIG